MIIDITSDEALNEVRKLSGVASNYYRVGSRAYISRGDFFGSLEATSLEYMAVASPLPGANELEKQLFCTPESHLLREIMGSPQNQMFGVSAILNTLPMPALDGLLKMLRKELQKVHSVSRARRLSEILSSDAWIRLGQSALVELGLCASSPSEDLRSNGAPRRAAPVPRVLAPRQAQTEVLPSALSSS